MSHKLKDEEFTQGKGGWGSTQGIDPKLDPNTLSIEDPRNPMVKRRRENAKQKGKDEDRARKAARCVPNQPLAITALFQSACPALPTFP